jgi:hypothetical protein
MLNGVHDFLRDWRGETKVEGYFEDEEVMNKNWRESPRRRLANYLRETGVLGEDTVLKDNA